MTALPSRSRLMAWSSLVPPFSQLKSRLAGGSPRLTPGTADCVSAGELIAIDAQPGGEADRLRRPALVWRVVEGAGGRLEWRVVEDDRVQMPVPLVGQDRVAA